VWCLDVDFQVWTVDPTTKEQIHITECLLCSGPSIMGASGLHSTGRSGML
jgi:hypothetical protein